MIPGFWLATVNPGKSSRKAKKPRKARKAAKKAVTVSRKKKLSALLKRLKVSRKAHLRGRPRRLAGLFGRRNGMAKVRKSRRPRRNAWKGAPRLHRKAALKGWARRMRKARKNPLFGARKRKSRKNPLWLRRFKSGKTRFMHLPKGRLMHRSKKTGRFHNNGPVLPMSWNPVLPVSWNSKRKAGRRARRNTYGYWHNPAATGVLAGLPVIGPAQAFLDVSFWTGTALPAAAGFIGTKTAGAFIHGLIPVAWLPANAALSDAVRIAADVVGASALSWGVSTFVDKQMGKAVFIGGVVSITHSVLKALLGGTQIGTAIGISGLGDELSDRMQQAVSQRVRAALSGMGSYLNVSDLQKRNLAGMGEFVTADSLRAQGGYAASPAATSLMDYDPLQESSAL
jgi:hypothetical protein